jgi:hypothetical protein
VVTEAFLGLARRGCDVVLNEQGEIGGVTELPVIVMAFHDRGPESLIERRRDGSFLWSCSPSGWLTNSLLVRALRDGPGFQYLSRRAGDALEIEVSYGNAHHGFP